MAQYAEEHGIPVLPAPKDPRKAEVVAPSARRFTDAEGVVCSLTRVEQGRTFVSYPPRYPPPSGAPNDRLIHAARKRFLPYSCYLLDPVRGPMSVRVGAFLPFTLACFLNGHSFLAQELTRVGVAYRKDDNAFLVVADLTALARAHDRLTPRLMEQRCDYWARQLAPPFSTEERAALPLAYRYSIAPIESATDVIVRRTAPLKALFGRATELGIRVGGADRTTDLCGRRITRRYRGKLQTVRDRRTEGQPILRSYDPTAFVKQYEKGDRLLRTETCLTDTSHRDIGRSLAHLPELPERMAMTNQRYLESQAELLATTVDGGDLAPLAQPLPVGQRRAPGVKLADDRVLRLVEGVLHPGAFVADWSSRAVHTRLLARHRLTEAASRRSHLRGDLGKLRAHGLVERLGTSRRYRRTPRGLKLGVLLVNRRTRLLGPRATLALDQPRRRPTRHPSEGEPAFGQVDAALDQLCATLGLTAA